MSGTSRRPNAETLDADYYRQRAQSCHQLANNARAPKPLYARLHVLATKYQERANAVESFPAENRSADLFTITEHLKVYLQLLDEEVA